jgi:hypothetical protein
MKTNKTSRPFKVLAGASLLLCLVIIFLPDQLKWLETPLLIIFAILVIISLFVPVNEREPPDD